MASGLSNHKISFNGVIKSGVAELLAVHHRKNYSPYKMTTAMLAIVTDSVIRNQKLTDTYVRGAHNL